MLQPSDIPLFQGDESAQESKQWMETLVASTGSFSDAGIFRLLTTKFPLDSPSREWYDNLDETLKEKWGTFELQFRSRWIAEAQRRADEKARWDTFVGHSLDSDVIFGKGVIHQSAIKDWAQEHLTRGKATKRYDSVLIETTQHLLPPFIIAYLSVNFDSRDNTFEDYCARISEVPSNVVEMEGIRAQISLGDKVSSMERKMEEIVHKVDWLVAQKQRNRQSPDSPHGSASGSDPLRSDPSSEMREPFNESIIWEPCSPVTSVASAALPPSTTTSELSTPVAQATPLPVTSESSLSSDGETQMTTTLTDPDIETELTDNVEQPLLCIPTPWRKPILTFSKKEMIATTQRAIDYILTFNEPFKASHSFSLKSSIAMYDKLVYSDGNKLKTVPKKSMDHDGLELPFSGLYGLHKYCAYENQFSVMGSVAVWDKIVDRYNKYRGTNNIILSSQPRIHLKDSNGSQGSDVNIERLAVGGLFTLKATRDKPMVSSSRTVLFMAFASYMAESGGSDEYRELAVVSAKFVEDRVLDPNTNLVKDCLINVTSLAEESGAALSCYLTGLTIEAFSVLGSATGDQSWTSLAIDIATAAMHYDDWHKPNGILNVGLEGIMLKSADARALKGLLNRGLMVAYQRNRSNKAFCNLVRSYVNVQANALIDLSRSQDSYGMHWGEKYTGRFASAQMAAIDTLVAAVAVNFE
ncbi:hypothetical protein FRC03_002221 [Tulasnella sp. 419]|nr:hypothetical protein FRC03_002221 [Tulasnella sp. 419]